MYRDVASVDPVNGLRRLVSRPSKYVISLTLIIRDRVCQSDGNCVNIASCLLRENVELNIGRGNTPAGKCTILNIFPGTVTTYQNERRRGQDLPCRLISLRICESMKVDNFPVDQICDCIS